jgi:pyridoxamine 5'-phosphate oxidase
MAGHRIVLLKEVNEKGFVFYTNYDSRKGHEIGDNPQGQILFFWDLLERQVRIEGRLEKVSAAESDEYFNSRPVDSRYGSIASAQSEVIPSREYLEEKLAKVKAAPPVRPDSWGGYVLIPDYFEFWQGRPSRLHDRIFYQANGNDWKTGRLSP